MLLAEVLCLWVFTTAPAMAALQTLPAHPHSTLLPRLDRLESLLADHQAQFQRERQQWEEEKETLRESLRHLQGDVLALQREKGEMGDSLRHLQGDVLALQREKGEMGREMQALHHTQALTQTLTADNQDLKARLGDVQRQLLSLDIRQQSLQDRVSRCEGKTSPDTAEDDQSPAGQQTGQEARTSEHQGQSLQGEDPSPHQDSDPDPNHHLSDPDPFKQHVRWVRFDDQGPLQIVVDHLAQTTTQLTADLQALSTKHSADLQALKTQHSADVQSLKTQHSADVQSLKTADAQQRQDIQAAQSSTFVQWGSSTCGGSAEMVYSGVLGGPWYTHTGAAANALCLTLSPRLLDMSPSGYTFLYGGEYATGDSHQDLDPVCAVCRAPHPSTVMVPGTNLCPAGWTVQYSGFLMAGGNNYAAATEFICVDSSLESSLGNQDDHDGHLLTYTKAQCGSLQCPPYQHDKIVTCAVCSK